MSGAVAPDAEKAVEVGVGSFPPDPGVGEEMRVRARGQVVGGA